MLGKIEGKRRRGGRDGITDSMDVNLLKLQEIVKDGVGEITSYSSWGHKELGTT